MVVWLILAVRVPFATLFHFLSLLIAPFCACHSTEYGFIMLGSLRFASVCCRNLGASGSRGAGTRLLSAYVKNSTGITGLEVVPEYKEVLTGLYNEILDVATGIPDHAFYRQHLEQDVKAHLELLETATDVRA